jgi:DNA-binding SARP family transcriptional activator
MGEMIELKGLGTCLIRTGKADIGPESEKVFAATLYLILERGRRVSRESLAAILWPDELSDERRQHRLRQTLVRMRQAGVPIQSSRSHIHIHSAQIQTDFDSFLTPDGAINPLSAQAKLFPDYLPAFSPAFLDWFEDRRDSMQESIIERLAHHMERAALNQDWFTADACATLCLTINPNDERAIKVQAEHLAVKGDTNGALRRIDILAKLIASRGPAYVKDITSLRQRIAEQPPVSPYAGNGPAPLIGRDDALTNICRLFSRVPAHGGHAYFIHGEPGIGKTRLVTECARRAALQGYSVVRGQCRPSDKDHPLSVVVDLVVSLSALPGALACSEDTLRYLRRLTDFDPQEHLTPEASDGPVLYARIRRGVFELLEAVSFEHPVLIVLEDLHLIDRESSALLGDITTWFQNHSVYLLLTSQSDHTPWQSTLSVSRAVSHRLLPLSDHDSSALFETLSGRDTLLEERHRLLPLAGGNPLFIEELADHAHDPNTQTWQPSLTSLIQHRLARLRPVEQSVMQAIVYLGRLATPERVEQLLHLPPADFLQTIGVLTDMRLITSFCGSVRPTHDLIAALVQQVAPPPTSYILHQKISSQLTRELHNKHDSLLLWECVRHWREAGDVSRAVELCKRCARYLMEVGLPLEAIDVLERALSECPDDPSALTLVTDLIAALRVAEDWSKMSRIITRFRSSASEAIDGHLHDDVEFAEIEATWHLTGDWPTALRRTSRCMSTRDASTYHRLLAARTAMKIAYGVCDLDAMDRIHEGTQCILPVDDKEIVFLKEIDLLYHACRGDTYIAETIAEDLVSRRMLSLLDRLTYMSHLGVIAFRNGHFARALEVIATGAMEAAHAHLRAWQVTFSTRAAFAAAEMTSNDTAWLHLNESFALAANHLGGSMVMAEAHYLRARLALLKDDLELALTDYMALSAIPGIRSHSMGLAACYALELDIALRSGNLLAQQPSVEALLSLHYAIRGFGGQDYETEVLLRALYGLGRSQLARDLLSTYLANYRRERSEPPETIRKLSRLI